MRAARNIMTVIAAALLTLGCGRSEDSAVVGVGMQAPDFTALMTDGSTFTLSEHLGEYVWLDFWATWCPPCRMELERVQEDVIDRLGPLGVRYVPVSRGEEPETVSGFLAESGYGFHSCLDPDESVFHLYAESSIPRNVIVGPDGEILFMELGYSASSFSRLIRDVESAVRERHTNIN